MNAERLEVDVSGDLGEAWRAIGSLREKVGEHSQKIALIEKTQDHGQKQFDNMCEQLKDTKKELGGKLDELLAKKAKDEAAEEHHEKLKQDVSILMKKHHEENGAGGIWKFMREVVPLIVSLIAIYSFLISPMRQQQPAQYHQEPPPKTQSRG